MQLSSLSLALTAAYGPGFAWRNFFTNNTPGFRINVEEAIRLNQQALGPELVTAAFTAGDGGTLVSQAAGVVTVENGDATAAYTGPNSAAVVGRMYFVSGRLVEKPTSSNARIIFGGVDSGTAIAVGRIDRIIVATGTGGLILANGSSAITGEKSVWSGISVREIDLSKCVAFQDSAGTLPVVSMEQPLGLILDTKFGSVQWGGELCPDGAFNAQGAWVLDNGAVISGGQLSLPTLSVSRGQYPIQTTAGRVYRVTATSSANTFCGAWAGLGQTGVLSDLAGNTSATSRSGSLAFTFRATGATSYIAFTSTGSTTPTVDNVSVVALPVGNHFVQPSNTASRPIVSRRVNLLVGTATLATQSVTTLAASHVLTFTGTGSVTLSGTATGTYSAGAHTITTTAGTLTVTVSGSVTNADLRLSSDVPGLPSYQRVTSSTDYDESGFPAYARFDGLDDWLESGVVDMSGTDAVTVIAGVKKRSDAASAMVLEFSVDAVLTNGAIFLAAPSGGGTNKYSFVSRGTLQSTSATTSTTYNAPHKALMTGVGRISTDTAILRVNGAQAASSSADQGTGNYGAHKFFIGRRAGTSLPFNGRLYGVTVIGKLLTDGQLAAAEQAERQLGRLY